MNSIDIFVHIGATIILIGYGIRDQLVLRGLVVIGTLFYVVFYLSMEEPLWASLMWNALFISINLFMMNRIYQDRRMRNLSKNEEIMYRFLHNLSPGEFRKISGVGDIRKTSDRLQITIKDVYSRNLYLVLDGAAEVNLSDKSVLLGSGAFIGEIGFLRGTKSSSDVFLVGDTTYCVWNFDSLREIFEKNVNLKNNFTYLLAHDVTNKLSNQ